MYWPQGSRAWQSAAKVCELMGKLGDSRNSTHGWRVWREFSETRGSDLQMPGYMIALCHGKRSPGNRSLRREH